MIESLIIVKIIVTALLASAVHVLLDKWKVMVYLQTKSTRFIRKWAMCNFCVIHTFAVPIAPLVAWYFGFEWLDLALPIMAASFKNLF